MKRTLSLLFILICATASAQVNLSVGLIGHYPFDGNANDVSGNNIHGNANNVTLTTDRTGAPNSAYYFNGTSSYISLPFSSLYNFAPTDSFSISVWILPDQGFTSWPVEALIVKSPFNSDVTLAQWNYGMYLVQYRAMSGYHINHIVNGTTLLVDNPCWYNLIVTYKNGMWKLYVNGVLESSDLSQTRFITQDVDTRISFGKKGLANGDWYKGKMDEIRLYNRVLNQQEVSAIVGTCFVSCPQKNDFSFERNSCDPYKVNFSTSASNFSSINWDFGDGNTDNAVTSTSHTYSASGNYLVTMITNYPTCADTVKKTITVDIQNDNQLISTPDGIICKGSTKQLQSSAGLNYCWTPTTFLDNPTSQNPVSSATQNITYYLTSLTYGTNLITNGNFNGGNTGFTSQYNFANPNTTEGEYYVGPNPQAWNASLSNCTDHTGSNGNMMLVNGAPVADVKVWSQTVTVTPNTNYAFSTWIQALWPPNPAQLSFSINGTTVGSLITASLPTCTWNQFYTNWNSGSNTSATISIVNKNTQVQGNDFALDDISFAQVFMKKDSVKITVEDPLVNTTDNTTICKGGSVQLNTTGAATYSWSPVTGLSNPAIGNPVATPAVTTRYYVTGTTTNNCTAKDSIDITVNPSPSVVKSADTTICQGGTARLSANGGAGTTYSWTPAATLSNSTISNPLATPSVPTTYYVTVTNSFSCSTKDSIKVDVRAPNNFTINPPVDVCLKKSVQLNATGGDLYSWQPSATLNNGTLSNPTASPSATTTYTVQIRDTLCGNNTSLSTVVTVLSLPSIKASKSNDLDCIAFQSQLQATGGILYSWSPSGSLNNPSIQGPLATPTSTTQYTVTGTDGNGCTNTDTVTVKVSNTNNGGYLMPTAFTPNNDGINDCYGIKYWGLIQELDFSIYNRWGQLVFHTSDPSGCWDGTFKGIKQDGNVFIYMIKAKTSCQGSIFKKGTFLLIR